MEGFNPLNGDGDTREVVEMNANGTLGVSLGKDIQDDLGITDEDTVGIEHDEEKKTVTIHTGDD